MFRRLLACLVPLFLASAASAQVVLYNPYANGGYYWASQGNYANSVAAKNYAQAARLREVAKQEAINTGEKTLEFKKKDIEHTKWELENKPYAADFEKRNQAEAIKMQMIAAKPGDIIAGYALNVLKRQMERHSDLLDSDTTPLPELLREGGLAKRINFTDGTGNSATGLLMVEKINWQGVLQEDVFEADRNAVEALLKKALEAAERGSSPYMVQKELRKKMEHMEDVREAIFLDARKKGYGEPIPHMAAKRQLAQLQQSINILDKQNLSETVAMRKSVEATTIGKLIVLMQERGWQFAPASAGNEGVYTGLYNKMRTAMDNGKFPQ